MVLIKQIQTKLSLLTSTDLFIIHHVITEDKLRRHNAILVNIEKCAVVSDRIIDMSVR